MHSKNVLLIDDGAHKLELAELTLESHFHLQVEKAQSITQAKSWVLDSHKDYSFILCPYVALEIQKKGTSNDLMTLKKLKLPLLIYQAPELEKDHLTMEPDIKGDPPIKFQRGPFQENELIKLIQKVMPMEQAQNIDSLQTQEDLKKVKGLFLTQFSHTDYDLYLEISPGKTLQVATKENKDMKSVINHYRDKGLDYFLLAPEDYQDFIEHTKELLKNHGPNPDALPREGELIEVSFDELDLAFTVAQDQLKALNINRIHQDFVNRSLEGALSDLKKNKDLFQKLKSLISTKDYVSNHSDLNIYFASYLLTKLNWANEQSLRQMIYACFYHDFEVEDPKLAAIDNLENLPPTANIESYKNHPKRAAKLIEELKGLNHDAYKIVMDHHEKPDGSGFPQGLNAKNIPPMSCVFILSHKLVDFLIQNNFQTQYLATKFQEMESTWNTGNLKRPFACAREILLD